MLTIVGAGGHAKVVLSVAVANAEVIRGFVDDNPLLLNQTVGGYPVLGDFSFISSEVEAAVIGLGNNLLRKNLSERFSAVPWRTLVHPNAYVHPSVRLGKGTVVFAGAVIQPDVVIGDHCIINTGTTVDHDCVIGDYVHLAPGVHLAGQVSIGIGSFLGIGSVVIPGIQMGEWVQVAAGAVVVQPVSARKTVMGVPAKERV